MIDDAERPRIANEAEQHMLRARVLNDMCIPALRRSNIPAHKLKAIRTELNIHACPCCGNNILDHFGFIKSAPPSSEGGTDYITLNNSSQAEVDSVRVHTSCFIECYGWPDRKRLLEQLRGGRRVVLLKNAAEKPLRFLAEDLHLLRKGLLAGGFTFVSPPAPSKSEVDEKFQPDRVGAVSGKNFRNLAEFQSMMEEVCFAIAPDEPMDKIPVAKCAGATLVLDAGPNKSPTSISLSSSAENVNETGKEPMEEFPPTTSTSSGPEGNTEAGDGMRNASGFPLANTSTPEERTASPSTSAVSSQLDVNAVEDKQDIAMKNNYKNDAASGSPDEDTSAGEASTSSASPTMSVEEEQGVVCSFDTKSSCSNTDGDASSTASSRMLQPSTATTDQAAYVVASSSFLFFEELGTLFGALAIVFLLVAMGIICVLGSPK
ncbi:unnamed protein product [Amoebophrya sp. A120]|nr:unnamed protein product [Amoebophrya sp. A120]|eukprot:GSA120T00001484001.1